MNTDLLHWGILIFKTCIILLKLLCLPVRGQFLYCNVLLKENKLLNHFIWFHLSPYAALVTTFNLEIGITGAILTKLDGDSRGGAALSVKEVWLHQFSLLYNIIVEHMMICPLKSYDFMSFYFSKHIWCGTAPQKLESHACQRQVSSLRSSYSFVSLDSSIEAKVPSVRYDMSMAIIVGARSILS